MVAAWARGTQGSIVFVSSMQGVHPFESSTAYAGAKAALIHGAQQTLFSVTKGP